MNHPTPRLLLVEGLPGTGKTSTASFVAEWLGERGLETALFLEGALDHPADFESVACLDPAEFDNLLGQFPDQDHLLQGEVIREGDDYFLHYRLLQQTVPQLSEALLAALARYEIYELPAAKFRRLLRRRWQQFAAKAEGGNTIYVFECCFLQNPLTMMLGRHDETLAVAQAFILELATLVQPLHPRWLYLNAGDARTTLVEAAQSRPREWLDFVIAYHTGQGHGKAQGWQGFAGLVNFYEMRQALERALLPQLPFPGLLLNQTGLVQDREQIARFLKRTFAS